MFDWRDFRKATYRGAPGSKLHRIQNLTPEEAKHFLLHDPHGRALQRDFPNVPFDQLADHVCEASRRPTEKHEVSMDKSLKVIAKSENAMHALCKHLAKTGGAGFTHPQFDEVLGRYAANKFPALRLGTAIAKVLAEETPVAKAYQAVHAAYYPAYKAKPAAGDAPAVADPDEEDVADEEEADKDEKEDEDAMEELERLAAEARRRNPSMSKQQAFTKVFVDPSNAKLAQRERRQSLAKMR